MTDFNPRPRKKGDSYKGGWVYVVEDFNPRPRKEGDARYNIDNETRGAFQSTPS